MMNDKTYIAITIGPIGNAMSLADGPGALWCASALFSDLSYRICCGIRNTWGTNANFLCPAFCETDDTSGTSFPDRIHVSLPASASPAPKETLHDIISEAIRDIANELIKTVSEVFKGKETTLVSFLQEYFQVNYIIAPEHVATANGQNCILNFDDILNSLECSGVLPANCTEHPLLTLFNSRTEGMTSPNAYLRKCYLVKDDTQLLNAEKTMLRDIESIASGGATEEGKKARNYFAVLYADGDYIGSLLRSLPEEEAVQRFSEACLQYNHAASKLVADYGGMTIYAGGDDLLCLLPLRGRNKENLLQFSRKLTKAFDDSVGKIYQAPPEETPATTKAPSVSIGISVNYLRYPLYEALDEARSMLFGVAKKDHRSIAISVRKGSGQSFGLLLPNEEGGAVNTLSLLINQEWEALAKIFGGSGKDAPKDSNVVTRSLHSILYALYNFNFGFRMCKSQNIITENLFRNFFDSGAHDANRTYINIIQGICEQQRTMPFFKALLGNKCDRVNCGKGAPSDEFCDCVEAMLRFAKLYSEEAGK